MPSAEELSAILRQRHLAVSRSDVLARRGQITHIVGLLMESRGPKAEIGELVAVWRTHATRSGATPIAAEVVGFRDGRVLLLPLEAVEGLSVGAEVEATGRHLEVGCGPALLGRVLDGLGRPIDGRGPLVVQERRSAEAEAPPPLVREPISQPLSVGVRAIDGLLTCGRGQRLGIFAGSGVGKSTLLGMLCRHTAAQVAVVALIGERGREVKEFIERDLGPSGLERAVVVVATSDQPAVSRIKAPLVATAIAEYFRDQGSDVLLVMDSLTRFALALREAGLASGEPPATRGYTPSVFAALPRLVERSGRFAKGSITAFYTVLVEGDDFNEPVADAVRGLLDGHIILSRDLAARGHYPAIDILQSISRLGPTLVDGEQRAAAQRVREVLSVHDRAQDLIDVGAYRAGSNPEIDHAIAWRERVGTFLRQERDEHVPWDEMRRRLLGLAVRAAERGRAG